MSALRTPAARDEPAPLSVLFDYAPFVVAMSIRWVERLILMDDAALPADAREPLGGRYAVNVVNRAYAAWDLSELLGRPAAPRAWALLSLPHRGDTVLLALRTPSCVAVSAAVASTALAPGVFAERQGAVAGAFSLSGLGVRAQGAVVGLMLDASQLWTPAELDVSAATLKSRMNVA
jgi:hypothetical protein